MKWIRLASSLALMTSAAFITGSGAAEPAKPANFQEVLSLVRSNLAGMNAAELDSLALDGLLEKLKGRVALASDSADADAPGSLTRTNTFDDAFAYWRVSRVGPGVAGQFKESLDKLSGEKKLKGLVLDLRFAKGSDYAAATAVADLFVTAAKPQIEVGGKTFSSTAKDKAVVLPVAVLVNRQTSGAAEALAALVRLNRIGLLIGGATAGEASQFKEFPLSNGQRLRVSTGVIRLADSSPLLPTGVQPDIAVNVSLADEKLFIEDAFRDLKAASPSASTSVNSTNGARKRLNEAELVRRRREGLSEDEDAPDSRVRMSEQARPLVRDPALARALDLLKGLAVVGRARPL